MDIRIKIKLIAEKEGYWQDEQVTKKICPNCKGRGRGPEDTDLWLFVCPECNGNRVIQTVKPAGLTQKGKEAIAFLIGWVIILWFAIKLVF